MGVSLGLPCEKVYLDINGLLFRMNELFGYHCDSLLYNVLDYIRSAKRSLGLILVHQSLLGRYWDISAVSMGYQWGIIGIH